MNHEPKLFLKKLKVYFATIFSRTMSKAVFGVPGLNQNQSLFSNIGLQEAELYAPDPEYFVHLVTFKDEEWFNDLIELFPLFKDSIVLLQVDKFLTGVNKHKGDVTQLHFVRRNTKVYIVYAPDSVEEESECGEIISSYQARRYYDIFEQGRVDLSSVCKTPFPKDIDDSGKPVVMNLGALFPDRNELLYNYVAYVGRSTIALTAFLKTIDLHEYLHEVIASREKDTVKLNVAFTSLLIDVLSVQPALVWFPKRNKS